MEYSAYGRTIRRRPKAKITVAPTVPPLLNPTRYRPIERTAEIVHDIKSRYILSLSALRTFPPPGLYPCLRERYNSNFDERLGVPTMASSRWRSAVRAMQSVSKTGATVSHRISPSYGQRKVTVIPQPPRKFSSHYATGGKFPSERHENYVPFLCLGAQNY